MFDGKSGSELEKRWEFNAFTKDEFHYYIPIVNQIIKYGERIKV